MNGTLSNQPLSTQTLSADTLIGRVPLSLRVLATGLVFCGLIAALVIERAMILRHGSEIRLATAPIDPRDLFRGDYVVLTYDISTVNLTRHGLADLQPVEGQRLYISLRPGVDGRGQVVGVSARFPDVTSGTTVLAGTYAGLGRCDTAARDGHACQPGDRMARLTYGLESFFVPEGEGLTIERMERARVEVVAAVSASGKAAIKRLLIDGKTVYDEPPF